MPRIDADPAAVEVAPNATALVSIGVQRNFLQPGGFGATVGNHVSRSAPPSRLPRASSPPAAPPASRSCIPARGHRPDLTGLAPSSPDFPHAITRAIPQAGPTRRPIDAFVALHRLSDSRDTAETPSETYDAPLLPTVPFRRTLAKVEAVPIGVNLRLGTFTSFANLRDLAGIAVPAGLDASGRPVGVTPLGPAWSEGRLAGIADALHRNVTGATLPPPADPDRLASDETALFCIGAHVSGLPLNKQLTVPGGRFLRAARAAPACRLDARGNRPGPAPSANPPPSGTPRSRARSGRSPPLRSAPCSPRSCRRSASAPRGQPTHPASAFSLRPPGSPRPRTSPASAAGAAGRPAAQEAA